MHPLLTFFGASFLTTTSPCRLQQLTKETLPSSVPNNADLICHQVSTVAVPDLLLPPDFTHEKAAPLPKTLLENYSQPTYVAHNAPVSTYLILNSPAIASFVLVKGWKQKESLERFTKAVNTVVAENPVLTGRATCPDNWWTNPEIDILPGCFNPGQHNFVETIDLRDKLQHRRSLDERMTTEEQLHYIDKHVAPKIGKHDSTLEQIHNKSPLFSVKVVLLPDDYACIYTKMSHCVGDLVTYYMLMDQISSLDKGDNVEELRPIEWDNPIKASHEIFPDELSKRDINRLYGLPFILGVGSHLPTMCLRKQEYILLDDQKIKAQKKWFKEAKGYDGITSNDVITSALCDANRSTDVFALTRSMRGVTPGLYLRDGGNLHCEVPFHRIAGRNPMIIQSILDTGRYFEPDEVPFFDSLTGRVGRISNCVAPMSRMSFGGLKPICYCPSKAFLNFTPLDTAIIFRAKSGETAVLHNFQTMVPSEQLDAIRKID